MMFRTRHRWKFCAINKTTGNVLHRSGGSEADFEMFQARWGAHDNVEIVKLEAQ